MTIVISIIAISGFGITIYNFFKVKKINGTMKNVRKIALYIDKYKDLQSMFMQKNIPSDMYDRTSNLNKQLFHNIKKEIKDNINLQFSTVDKTDVSMTGLQAFIDDTIITIERDVS